MEQIRYKLSETEATTAAMRTSLGAAVFALTLQTLACGTGGAYSNEQVLLEKIRDSRGPVEYADTKTRNEVQYAFSPAELLSNLRNTFGLKMSELAQVFGVSRRTAYDWAAGTQPRPELVTRIYRLSKIADDIRDAGVTNASQFMHRPIQGDRSFLELLKTEDDLRFAVAVIKKTADEEASSRLQRSRRVSASKSSRADEFDEVSTPIYS